MKTTNRITILTLLAVALHLALPLLHAQVPQLINYQGRVAVGIPPVNFDGAGSFKFALVNAAGTTTYWSNDGTSVNGSQPTAAVSLTVTKGLYSVLLGDTAITNMTAIPASVWANADVRLRVWFDDGANGSQLLAPDQRLAPNGYLPDGSVSSNAIADDAVTSAKMAAGAVQGANIADGAVTTDKLADGAVTIPKFSPGYLSANTDIFSAGQPYTSAQTGELTYSKTFDVPFAPGTTPEVILPEGWVLDAAATETGFSATATFAPVLVDDGDYNPPASKHNVGEYSSLARIDGRPAIAYRDTTSLDLRYVIATDAMGTAWDPPVLVDAVSSAGASVSLAVIGGRPAISYWVAGTTNKLKFAIATDASGSSWAFTNVLDSDYPFGRTSLAIVNGFPAIATTVGNAIDTTRALTYFIAATADGSGAWTTVTVDSTTDAGSRTSLAVVNGNPAISYVDTVNSKLRYIRADDPLGATWPAGPNLNVADAAPATGTCSMAIIEGYPAIAFREDLTSAGDTGYVRALDADGATWGPVKTANSAGQSGSISLSVIAGRPAICSTLTASSYGLRFAVATDTTGASWTNMQVVAPPSGSLFLRDASLMDLNGRAAVCYSHQSGGGLWFMLLPDFPDWSASSGEVHPFLAARSAGVTDGAITSASIASGAVGSAQLGMGAVQSGNIAAGAVTTTQIADGAVGSAQLGTGAVQSGNIAAGAVTTTQIADGAVGSAQLGTGAVQSGNIAAGAVTTTQIADGAVGSAQLGTGAVQSGNIAAGAITTTQIAPGTVDFANLAKPPQSGTVSGAGLSFDFGQASFTAVFPQAYAVTPVVALSLATASAAIPSNASLRVTATDGTQFSGRMDALTSSSVTPDSAGSVGSYTSLAVVNGNPAISYFDNTNGDLKYVRATDASGTTWGTPITLDSTGNVGWDTSLAVINGNPAISYYDQTNGDLKYVRATDASGTTWGTPVTIESTFTVGQNTSLAVVNGNPAISYYDITFANLKYVRATDASGTAWDTPVTVDSTGFVGQYTSLAVVNGNPAISYNDQTNADLKYVRATDASGTAWDTPVTLDSTGSVGQYTSLAVVNGNPAISYYDITSTNLKYVRATDASGTAWDTPVTLDSTGIVGQYTSLAVVNGNPAISYYDQTNADLKYVRATDASGNSWGTPVTLGSIGDFGQWTSLAVVSGSPAISYRDSTNGDLKFIRQVNPSTSFSINWIALPP